MLAPAQGAAKSAQEGKLQARPTIITSHPLPPRASALFIIMALRRRPTLILLPTPAQGAAKAATEGHLMGGAARVKEGDLRGNPAVASESKVRRR